MAFLRLLPFCELYCTLSNKSESLFDFYFKNIASAMYFTKKKLKNYGIGIADGLDNLANFFVRFAWDYSSPKAITKKEQQQKISDVILHLKASRKYERILFLNCDEIMQDEELYNLIKQTWVGSMVTYLTGLREKLTQKLEAHELNLENLFPE